MLPCLFLRYFMVKELLTNSNTHIHMNVQKCNFDGLNVQLFVCVSIWVRIIRTPVLHILFLRKQTIVGIPFAFPNYLTKHQIIIRILYTILVFSLSCFD